MTEQNETEELVDRIKKLEKKITKLEKESRLGLEDQKKTYVGNAEESWLRQKKMRKEKVHFKFNHRHSRGCSVG